MLQVCMYTKTYHWEEIARYLVHDKFSANYKPMKILNVCGPMWSLSLIMNIINKPMVTNLVGLEVPTIVRVTYLYFGQ
jgi:hypothetical protein